MKTVLRNSFPETLPAGLLPELAARLETYRGRVSRNMALDISHAAEILSVHLGALGAATAGADAAGQG